MTAQEIFDISCAHLLRAGRPSIGETGCVYSGTGCALAPFIPAGENVQAWDEAGAIDDLPPDWLTPDMHEHFSLMCDLQTAHDWPYRSGLAAAQMPLEQWRRTWLEAARRAAARHRLSPAILDQGFAA